MAISRRALLQGAAAAGGLLATRSLPALAQQRRNEPRGAEQRDDRHDRRRDDGEPVVRPLPRLDARRAIQTGPRPTSTTTAPSSHARTTWAPDYRGCGHPDPGHGWDSGRVQLGGEPGRQRLRRAGQRQRRVRRRLLQRRRRPRVGRPSPSRATIFDHVLLLGARLDVPNRWYQHGGHVRRSREQRLPADADRGLPDKTIWDRCDGPA